MFWMMVIGYPLAPFPIRLVVEVTLLVMVTRATLRSRLPLLGILCRLIIGAILVSFRVKLAILTCYGCLAALATMIGTLIFSVVSSCLCKAVVSVLGLCGSCSGWAAPE